MQRTNEVLKGVIGMAASTVTVAVSFVDQIVLALRLLGLVLGLAVSAAMLWSIVATRAERRRWAATGLQLERVRLQEEQGRLCQGCREGRGPLVCPIPQQERPRSCPRLKAAGLSDL